MQPLCPRENIKVIQASKGRKKKKNSQEETKIADPVHDEGFLGCIVEFLVFKPEPDQKIGTQTDSFPADKQDEITGTHDQ